MAIIYAGYGHYLNPLRMYDYRSIHTERVQEQNSVCWILPTKIALMRKALIPFSIKNHGKLVLTHIDTL